MNLRSTCISVSGITILCGCAMLDVPQGADSFDEQPPGAGDGSGTTESDGTELGLGDDTGTAGETGTNEGNGSGSDTADLTGTEPGATSCSFDVAPTTDVDPECGNGIPEGDEECDDGNQDATDGCTELCLDGPTAAQLTGRVDTPQYGNTSGGDPHEDACPAGQALVAFEGRKQEGYHGLLNGECRSLVITQEGSEPALSLGGVSSSLPTWGEQADSPTTWRLECPTGEVVVGFSGYADTDYLRQLKLRCAAIGIALVGNDYEATIGSVSETTAVGEVKGAAIPATDCPAGHVARMQRVRSGWHIDAFGLSCSRLELVQ